MPLRKFEEYPAIPYQLSGVEGRTCLKGQNGSFVSAGLCI